MSDKTELYIFQSKGIGLMKYAPILIPTLCRADKFRKCIESLKKNKWAKYTSVYVALDYPSNDTHWRGYKEICEYLKQDFTEFAEFNIIKRKTNYGSSKNVSEVRDRIFQRFDRYIYTDDDIEFSENFLEYIDKTMELYDDDPNIIAVCGYSYPLQWKVSQDSTVFKTTTGLFMWGTGFWRDKYVPIKKSIEGGVFRREYATYNRRFWRKKLIDVRYLDFLGLGTAEKGLLDCSSDISLSTYMELYNKYAVIPVISKARNHGFDGSGVYCQKIDDFSFDAGNYDYSNQEIDKMDSFDVISDTFCYDTANRKLWEAFDSRKNIKAKILKKELKYFLRKLIGNNNSAHTR